MAGQPGLLFSDFEHTVIEKFPCGGTVLEACPVVPGQVLLCQESVNGRGRAEGGDLVPGHEYIFYGFV